MKTVMMTIAAMLIAATVTQARAGTPMTGMAMKSVAKTGSGVGIVKAIDARTETLTIAHGPIPGVGWPAMTMTFKAAPAVLKGLATGRKIAFDLSVTDSAAVVTRVKAM